MGITDKELADKVVALGVGFADIGEYAFSDGEFRYSNQSAKRFVRDWRVAGALMEKMTASRMLGVFGPMAARARPDPRAITEACVEALT